MNKSKSSSYTAQSSDSVYGWAPSASLSGASAVQHLEFFKAHWPSWRKLYILLPWNLESLHFRKFYTFPFFIISLLVLLIVRVLPYTIYMVFIHDHTVKSYHWQFDILTVFLFLSNSLLCHKHSVTILQKNKEQILSGERKIIFIQF